MWQRSNSPVWLYVCTVLLAAARADNNCPYKECMCGGTYIECQNLGLTSMPIYDSSGVGGSMYLTLTLDANQITEIPSDCFPPGLTEISLIDNPITTIDNNAFISVSSSLESLYFMNPRLTRIPNAFLQLDGLQHLNLVNCKILDWNPGAMAHIGPTMQTLNFENVGLSAWPSWLKFFTQLNELNLDGNDISFIPDGALNHLAGFLLTLVLSNNKFTAIPPSTFALTSLITIDMQGNKISNLTGLPQSDRLSDISLINNSISDAPMLSDILRPVSDSLLTVSLSYNKLTIIPDFSFLTKVRSFDLSQNRISDPQSGSMHSMAEISLVNNLLPIIPAIFKYLKYQTYLRLDYNAIRMIRRSDLPTWTTQLYLPHNLITELTDTSFPKNSSLTDLDLSSNPLGKISDLAFQNVPNLSRLYLHETKLARLPAALLRLPRLNYLDLTDCPNLVCTCLEKNLGSRIESFSLEVSGNCGIISIYTFYATFSLTCP